MTGTMWPKALNPQALSPGDSRVLFLLQGSKARWNCLGTSVPWAGWVSESPCIQRPEGHLTGSGTAPLPTFTDAARSLLVIPPNLQAGPGLHPDGR